MYSVYDTYAAFGTGKAEPAPDAAAPAPELEAKQGEVVEVKPKKDLAMIAGTRIQALTHGSLISAKGKYLRPGGRDETGWTTVQRKNA